MAVDKDLNSSEGTDTSEPDSWMQGVQQLLIESRISFLASMGEHGPETSMAPFAIHEGKILLHLSSLAKHTRNIERKANIGMMICTPERLDDSPLALPRLSLQGKATHVDDEDMADEKLAYLKRIPDAEQLFSFADFCLFQLTPSHIYWVGGFGKARKVSLQQWQALT